MQMIYDRGLRQRKQNYCKGATDKIKEYKRIFATWILIRTVILKVRKGKSSGDTIERYG